MHQIAHLTELNFKDLSKDQLNDVRVFYNDCNRYPRNEQIESYILESFFNDWTK